MTPLQEANKFDALLERYMEHFKDSPAMRVLMQHSRAESCVMLQHALDTNTPIKEVLGPDYLT